jgi:hypothetical protein
MSAMTFTVETDTGEESVTVDTDELLGELTPEEFMLLTTYVERSGLSQERALAGGYVLVLLSRKVDVDHKTLLEAVL